MINAVSICIPLPFGKRIGPGLAAGSGLAVGRAPEREGDDRPDAQSQVQQRDDDEPDLHWLES